MLRDALDFLNYENILTENLLKMAEIVLKNSYFEFNSKVFQQTLDTAIGTKFAQSYACSFMDQHKTKFLETHISKPAVWFRYIDGIFFIWAQGEEKLKKFMEDINSSFFDEINFTYEFDKDSIYFLDLKIASSNGKLMTSLYNKPVDCHQYLHHKSGHPEYTKQSIIYSQAIRVKRVCSQESDFKNTLLNLNHSPLKEVILKKTINTEMKNVLGYSSRKINNKIEKRTPFVVTFHLRLKILQK